MSDWVHLQTCLVAIDKAEPSVPRAGPCQLADGLAGAALRCLRDVGCDEVPRSAALSELMSTAAVAAEYHVAVLAFANADSADARQSWMTWASRSLSEGGGAVACRFFKPRAVLAVAMRDEAMSPTAKDCPVHVEEEAIAKPFVKVRCSERGRAGRIA